MAEAFGLMSCTSGHLLESQLSHMPESTVPFRTETQPSSWKNREDKTAKGRTKPCFYCFSFLLFKPIGCLQYML